jgi:hypothetical protein
VALLAWSRAASAQSVDIEIEATPVATTPSPGAPVRVSIATIGDEIGAFPNAADKELLDTSFVDAIAAHPSAPYSTIRLASASDPCDRPCRTASARRDGAAYLVVPEIRQFAGAYVVSIEIVRASDGTSVRTLQSAAAAAPADLLEAAKRAADDVAAAIEQAEGLPAAPLTAPNTAPTWTGAQPQMGVMRAGMSAFESPEVARYRSNRNAGVAVFVIGILLQGVGGGLWGAGEVMGEEAMYYSGIGIAAFGDVLFWAGLGGWIVNQVRMNKVERGIPLSRGLRLEGLAPIVASRDGGFFGWSASMSF